MKYFSYRAVDLSGNISTGTLSAGDEVEVESLLSASGKSLLSYRRTYRISSGSKWSRRDLIDFVFHLEQLVAAGIPLLEALEEFRRAADKKAVATVTAKLMTDIDAGKKFSEACARSPAVFSPLVVGLLSVGEQSGTLDKVLRDLGVLLKWQDETVSRVKRVMIYPAFVAVVLLVVIVFVMTWLVPGLISFVKSAGAELPWHTKALLATSDFISAYWRIISATIAGCYVGVLLLLKRSAAARIRFDALVLKLPLIGVVLFKIKLARFSRCVAMMYSAGISVIDTLMLSEAVVDNKHLAGNLQKIRAEISAGKPLSDSFAGCAVLPPIVSRMVRVGESTGAIDNAFNQLGNIFDWESKESIERLEQGLGPVMIITVGIIMMWVVISVIGPIYDLVFSMSGQF